MSKEKKSKHSIQLNDKEIDFIFTKRRRQKHIRIKIEQTGEVIISGPNTMSEKHAKEILLKKAEWIIKNREKQVSKKLPDVLKALPFKGSIIKVSETLSNKNSINLEDTKLIITHNEKQKSKSKTRLLNWLKKEAKSDIEILLQEESSLSRIKYKKISIRNQKTRWGSSSSSGTLSFNFRIIMCPLFVREYLAVHELCHQKHPNHSKKFWKEVEKWHPDYKKAELWLKKNSQLMNLFR